MSFSETLRDLRKRESLTQTELASKMGISPSAISMYECGMREPDFETFEAFADFFNVNMDYLMGKISSKTNTAFRIPVLGKVAAGIPMTAAENIIDWEEIPASWAADAEYVALQIKGRSMEPRIMEGDVIIVKVTPEAESGDIAVVMVNGDEATVKRIKLRPEGLLLIPNNPEFETMFYSNEEIESLPVKIFGKVVELRGKL